MSTNSFSSITTPTGKCTSQSHCQVLNVSQVMNLSQTLRPQSVAFAGAFGAEITDHPLLAVTSSYVAISTLHFIFYPSFMILCFWLSLFILFPRFFAELLPSSATINGQYRNNTQRRWHGWSISCKRLKRI